jgi:hypothetical protein
MLLGRASLLFTTWNKTDNTNKQQIEKIILWCGIHECTQPLRFFTILEVLGVVNEAHFLSKT